MWQGRQTSCSFWQEEVDFGQTREIISNIARLWTSWKLATPCSCNGFNSFELQLSQFCTASVLKTLNFRCLKHLYLAPSNKHFIFHTECILSLQYVNYPRVYVVLRNCLCKSYSPVFINNRIFQWKPATCCLENILKWQNIRTFSICSSCLSCKTMKKNFLQLFSQRLKFYSREKLEFRP